MKIIGLWMTKFRLAKIIEYNLIIIFLDYGRPDYQILLTYEEVGIMGAWCRKEKLEYNA